MENHDTQTLKAREQASWQSAAEGWRRRDALLRKGAAPVTQRMLALAQLSAGSRLLDIASGTGEPAISAAKLVGDNGRVIGTDLVDAMLEVAREKAAQEQLQNIEFHCVDGERLEFPPADFDAVTIRWGLMFMPDPAACLRQAARALRPGGRVVLACWDRVQKNPFVGLLLQTLEGYMEVPAPAPGTPGIFALADPDRLRALLDEAGFSDIMIESMEIDVLEVDDGRAYWDAISDLAAPVMRLVEQLDRTTRARYVEEVIRRADRQKTGDTLRMPGTTWIAAAAR